MTTKELLYVEDALGHAQYVMTQCRQTASQLQDNELKTLVQQMENKQKMLFTSFYGLL